MKALGWLRDSCTAENKDCSGSVGEFEVASYAAARELDSRGGRVTLTNGKTADVTAGHGISVFDRVGRSRIIRADY
jgi:hypothetical protein